MEVYVRTAVALVGLQILGKIPTTIVSVAHHPTVRILHIFPVLIQDSGFTALSTLGNPQRSLYVRVGLIDKSDDGRVFAISGY